MLCNAAYAGHVSGLRDTSRSCMSRSSAMSWTPAQPLEERLRDLYAMGDITKPMYVMQRQVLEEELRRAKPPIDPDLDRAQTILEDFSRFWDAEPEPAERRKLILSLFSYGPRTTRSWPSSPTRRSPTTSPPRRRFGPRTQKPTRGMRQQYGSDGGRTRVRHHRSRFGAETETRATVADPPPFSREDFASGLAHASHRVISLAFSSPTASLSCRHSCEPGGTRDSARRRYSMVFFSPMVMSA